MFGVVGIPLYPTAPALHLLTFFVAEPLLCCSDPPLTAPPRSTPAVMGP